VRKEDIDIASIVRMTFGINSVEKSSVEAKMLIYHRSWKRAFLYAIDPERHPDDGGNIDVALISFRSKELWPLVSTWIAAVLDSNSDLDFAEGVPKVILTMEAISMSSFRTPNPFAYSLTA
jgi:hypothetical protein